MTWVLRCEATAVEAAAAGVDVTGRYFTDLDIDDRPGGPGELGAWMARAFTAEVAEAKHFDDAGEALRWWKESSRRYPVRLDGRPNRPRTAFTVTPVRA